ncbi:mandelate racemase/muconate lactonizing enzyme family protein [Saccharopolyspora sp. NPDC047091]|uniref:mandelate racemase/muconate lactonizing enzyme family protein n=1 Tax=Saccharopolyspora sp. NPDC047091 TaxID=3155924 RepID=UPI0033EE2E5F
MKITDISVDRLRLPLDPPLHAAWDPRPREHFDATVVRVRTDEGITGIGSGDTMTGFEAVRHLFVGTDPLRIDRHVKAIETANFHGGAFWPLEAALWDVIGKATGVPVSVLFGGATDALPAYASTAELKPPAERVESALAARQAGFRAMKIRIAPDGVEEGVATVAAVRDALGPDFDIMVDLNQSWRMAGDTADAVDFATTARTVRRLAEIGVSWVEEPLPYHDIAGFRALRARYPEVRIAAGEMQHSVPDLVRYLEQDVLDVYQMDVVLAVGMHRARTIAELARLKHRHFTPHSWTNGIGLLANLHVAAGVGGGPHFEFPYDPPGWTPQRRDFPLARPVEIRPDGMVAVPQVPGLGVELDEDVIAATTIGGTS